MTLQHTASITWSNNLRLNQEAAATIADLLAVDNKPSPYVHILPFSMLPVIDPEAFSPEVERSLDITSLPHFYLPDEVLAKSPRETMEAYGLRINLTLGLLGFIDNDDEGLGFSQQFAVDDDETAQTIVAYGDANFVEGPFGERYMQVQNAINEQWGGVYPRMQLSLLSAHLANVCTDGCIVLQCKHALEYGKIDFHEAAAIIGLMKECYGTLADMPDWSPANVSQYVTSHSRDLEEMKQVLLEQELMSEEMAGQL